MEALVIAILFAPLSWLYRLGTWLDQKLSRKHILPYPVVSIGNIAMGGRAKTPFVIYLCRKLSSAGYVPVVLTRGYGRKSKKLAIWKRGEKSDPLLLGDEATEIARSGAIDVILVGSKRAQNAERFILEQREHRQWVFVLDDGFQHWSIARDVDIVIVTPEDTRNRVVPWGELREPPKALARAHVVLELGKDLVKDTVLESSDRISRPLVLTTRAAVKPYIKEMKKRFRDLESVSLKDHASREKIIETIAKFRNGEVILGDKEAVKLLSDKEYEQWQKDFQITKKFSGTEKKLVRAFLRLTWQDEHRSLRAILDRLHAKMESRK